MASSSSRTHYVVLGVSEKATKDEIKSAYKKKALELHPDRHRSDNTDPEVHKRRFQEVANAYDVLKDDAARKSYDLQLHPVVYRPTTTTTTSSSTTTTNATAAKAAAAAAAAKAQAKPRAPRPAPTTPTAEPESPTWESFDPREYAKRFFKAKAAQPYEEFFNYNGNNKTGRPQPTSSNNNNRSFTSAFGKGDWNPEDGVDGSSSYQSPRQQRWRTSNARARAPFNWEEILEDMRVNDGRMDDGDDESWRFDYDELYGYSSTFPGKSNGRGRVPPSVSSRTFRRANADGVRGSVPRPAPNTSRKPDWRDVEEVMQDHNAGIDAYNVMGDSTISGPAIGMPRRRKGNPFESSPSGSNNRFSRFSGNQRYMGADEMRRRTEQMMDDPLSAEHFRW